MLFKYGIYEGSLDTPFGIICQDIARYFHKTLNATYEFHEVTVEEVDAFYRPRDILKEGMDLFCMPFSLNGGFYYDFYAFSVPTWSSEVILFSGVPTRKTETSLNGLFIFSDAVTVGLVNCVILVSILASLMKVAVYKARHFLRHFASSLYTFSLSMFRVPISDKPRSLSYRILMFGWLLAALVISAQQNSHFTTNLSIPVYFRIDTFADLKHYKEIILKVPKKTFEEMYLANLAKTDSVVSNLMTSIKESNSYYRFLDLVVDFEFRKNISGQRQVIMINTLLLLLLASLVMEEDEGLKYHVSPPLTQIIQGVIINSNVSKQTMEQINRGLGRMFERKSLERVQQKCESFLDARTWEMPKSKDDHFMSLEDCYLPLLFYLTANAIVTITILLQAIFWSYYTRNQHVMLNRKKVLRAVMFDI